MSFGKNIKFCIKVFLVGIFLTNSLFCFGANTSTQTLQAVLPTVLEISKIIVDNTSEYDRDASLGALDIKQLTQVNPDLNIADLNPLQVKIHTNLSTPINVNAEFQELRHSANLYNFATSDLSMSPSSYTINNPYDNIITNPFIPQVNIRPNVVSGLYNGTVMFTLGAL